MEFDPHAKFGFEILFEDEMPKYVTLDELKELIKDNAYKTEKDQTFLYFRKDQKTGLTYVDIQSAIRPTWLSSHILVNTCMNDPDAYDWRYITAGYDYYNIADIAYIWTHPYTWIPKDDNRLYGCLVSGKVATMKFDRGRVDKFLFDWFTKMLQERVLYLADKMPVALDEVDGGHRGSILRGMLMWDLITTDGKNFLKQFLKEDAEFDEEPDFFHVETFRDSIIFISQERGGKVAADLVRRLRKDWKAIVTWKCFGMDKISPEQIEDFRACLFEGMDYYLEQWDAEAPKEETPKQEASATTKSRGPKTQYLFADVRGNEDTSRTKTEAERVRKFVADHHMGNMQLDSKSTNRLNLLVACFWYRWNERKWVSQEPQGAAIYRFFTEQCGLECAVLQKAFSTKICNIINAGKKDYQIYDDLDSYFRE